MPSDGVIDVDNISALLLSILKITHLILKFPHNNIEDAIIKSVELLDHKNFKSYNIIDLRIDGKIIVR